MRGGWVGGKDFRLNCKSRNQQSYKHSRVRWQLRWLPFSEQRKMPKDDKWQLGRGHPDKNRTNDAWDQQGGGGGTTTGNVLTHRTPTANVARMQPGTCHDPPIHPCGAGPAEGTEQGVLCCFIFEEENPPHAARGRP